jgi:hypothetical protein
MSTSDVIWDALRSLAPAANALAAHDCSDPSRCERYDRFQRAKLELRAVADELYLIESQR